MTPRSFVARNPEDLIAVVPYLLGFHPQESVVLLTFGAPAGSFHARLDLPRSQEERAAMAEVLVEAVRTNRAAVTAVLVFSADAEAARAACATLVPALLDVEAVVVDAVRADGECWWSALDEDPAPHPYDARAHPFTAEQVLDGHAAFRSRDELADSIRGSDPDEIGRVAAAADEVASEFLVGGQELVLEAARSHAAWLCDQLGDHLARATAADDRPGVADAGRILALVQLDRMRDVVCSQLSRSTAHEHVRLWRDLLRRSPPDLVPGAAALLGLAAWLDGDGALAWCAIDRCQEVEPENSLALHLAGLLQHAVPPATWAPIDAATLPLLRGLEEAS